MPRVDGLHSHTLLFGAVWHASPGIHIIYITFLANISKNIVVSSSSSKHVGSFI